MEKDFGPDYVFKNALASGRFIIQRSKSSGRYVFYPRVFEPGTGSHDLEWVNASGEATIYSCTTVFPRRSAPYNISIVELAEGPRLMSQVIDIPPEQVRIGMKVYAQIVPNDNPTHKDDLSPKLCFSSTPTPITGNQRTA